MKKLIFAFVYLLLTVPCSAEIIIVDNEWPYDFNNIQAAIDYAGNGDYIIVFPGTYTGTGNRDIDFLGKAVTVQSFVPTDPYFVALTIIDCGGIGRAFNFTSGEDANSVLAGLTITNSSEGDTGGGAIYCYSNSSPTITNCIIRGNAANAGGGIFCDVNSSPSITNCTITNNSAHSGGGGICCNYQSNPTITNCTISGNSTEYGGGGIYCDYSSPTIANCTMAGNSADRGGGIYYEGNSNSKITNCIIWNNAAQTGAEIYGSADVTYSDVRGGYWGEGNINADPLLTPDGRLQADSPCIDAGNPDFLPELGQVDIDGQPRIMGGRVDIGADEVTAPLVSAIVLSSGKFYFNANEGGPNPQPQILSVRNIQEDTLSWEVTEDCPWLEVNPHSGISTFEPNYITLSVDVTGLAIGVYNCNLTISSPDAAPRMVSVTLCVCNRKWLLVPIEYPTIQSAIDASFYPDFNTVVVLPGTYTGPGNSDIYVYDKILTTVRSIVPTDPCIVAQTIIDCNGIGSGLHFIGENIFAGLDGFTITNAYSRGIYCHDSDQNIYIRNCIIRNNRGSGIYCEGNSNATISNCIITGNAGNGGGGIYCDSYSNPTITNCTITDNSANRGGGIFCDLFSIPTITNCTITENEAGRDGGGIYCMGDFGSRMDVSPKITNCTITDNSARTGGGGIYCDDSNATITNCTITGNSADDGGGICGFHGGRPIITGCIIAGNSVWREGGGIYCDSGNYGLKVVSCTVTGNLAGSNGGGIYYVNNYNSIFNSIIWGNTDTGGQGQSAQVYGGQPNVWFSCIKDDNPDDADIPFGEEQYNIDDDPCFVALGSGYWDDNNTPGDPYDDLWIWSGGDYHLLPASPCIEAGDPYFTYHAGDVDMDGQPRLMGRYIDMGADEAEISMVVVTKPRGGEVWAAGSTHEINWDSFDITGTVDISYSDNNGADWVIIKNSVTNTGSFIWHLPEAVDSNRCLISVEPNVPVPNLICTPSGLFTIHPCPPGPLVSSNWKSLGGNFDRTGLSENYGPELGCVKWQFQTNGPVSASPTVGADSRVHLSCEDGNLYTLDANGLLLWSYDTNSPLLSSPSIGPDGSVYVGAENGKLYAIDVNGVLRWTHSTDGFIYSSPAISADGNIFVCSQDGSLYALGRDGSELWTFETGGVSPVATGAIFASPVIGPNSTIYVAGAYNPSLYAIDSNTGSVKWICDFSAPTTSGRAPWPFASPIVAPDGTIYQTLLYDPCLYAIPGRLIAEGEFITIGGLGAKFIAAWGNNIWKPLGSGMTNLVEALTVYNDQLIAGGNFSTAGGVNAQSIAAWNGRYWQWLGNNDHDNGVWGEVYALTVYNSKLIVGGSFTGTSGVVTADHIAQWNGSSWQSLGSGVNNGVNDSVRALTVYNGQLIAGGDFTTAGGIIANYIAAWDGSSWQPLGNGMNRRVRALTVVHNSLLIAGGDFTTADGELVNYIAAWDGYNWWPLGLGMNHDVYALAVDNDELIAGGEFSKADGLSANNIAAWDGSSWRALGSGVNNDVRALMVYNGELIAGGSFSTAGGADANSIAAWNGSSWRSLESRMDRPVEALTVYNGDLIAGGEFTTAGNYGSVIWPTNLAGFFIQYGRNPDEYIIWYDNGDPLEYVEHDGIRYYYIEINGDRYDVYYEYDPADYRYDGGKRHYLMDVYPYAYCGSEPALGPDGTIYVSFDDSYLRAVEPNGSTKWVTRLGMVGGFTLTVGSNGLIYAASDDAYLCVVDPDGKEIARFKGDNWLSFPVITADNTMIVCDANNTVWAIGGSGCEGQTAALHRPQDLSADRAVSFNDFALFASDWLKSNCFTSDKLPPCDEYPDDGFYFTGDIDRDLYVDFADLAELANLWLSQE
jgi:parallel beta-helix repeat protein/predicted outer membrane repeat protein